MKKSFALCAALSLIVGLGACSKKQVKGDGDAAGDMSPTDVSGTAGTPIPELPAVQFAYDSFALTSSAKSALNDHANWLKANGRNVQIEGHCDERGTTEYNLALGERRAGVVKDYLVGKGVPASQLSTISYGEERPAASGSDESTWSRNRRAEFVSLGQ
jgi:peptidoglycan-associated lipoprotein